MPGDTNKNPCFSAGKNSKDTLHKTPPLSARFVEIPIRQSSWLPDFSGYSCATAPDLHRFRFSAVPSGEQASDWYINIQFHGLYNQTGICQTAVCHVSGSSDEMGTDVSSSRHCSKVWNCEELHVIITPLIPKMTEPHEIPGIQLS